MKVIWICHFSNVQIRKRLIFSNSKLEKFLRLFLNNPKQQEVDFAAWITNGIKEFEKIEHVDLHIISPHGHLKNPTQEFTDKGVHYHFFKSNNNSLITRILGKFKKQKDFTYNFNRNMIKNFITKINPDLIHMYGAENPYYSISALDSNIEKIPFLITLQTLMADSEFIAKNSIVSFENIFRKNLEKKILQKARYIASSVKEYRELVWKEINSDAIIFESGLAVAEKVNLLNLEKIYDFVYFSASIEKAGDVAIESFALACKELPFLTLNIVGGSNLIFLQQLKNRITELQIEKNVIFSGKLATHDDVLMQIQKSRYALLPLKIDHISGTIREAMFSGIPVITTRTYGTPSLNDKRESILISEQGDYRGMANNMIRLYNSKEFTEKIKNNGLMTVNEIWNNKKMMQNLVNTYLAIYNHYHYNAPIPTEIGESNPFN